MQFRGEKKGWAEAAPEAVEPMGSRTPNPELDCGQGGRRSLGRGWEEGRQGPGKPSVNGEAGLRQKGQILKETGDRGQPLQGRPGMKLRPRGGLQK